jgi:hypothetical protein
MFLRPNVAGLNVVGAKLIATCLVTMSSNVLKMRRTTLWFWLSVLMYPITKIPEWKINLSNFLPTDDSERQNLPWHSDAEAIPWQEDRPASADPDDGGPGAGVAGKSRRFGRAKVSSILFWFLIFLSKFCEVTTIIKALVSPSVSLSVCQSYHRLSACLLSCPFPYVSIIFFLCFVR